MGRPVFTYELGDPDFSWLISNFQENHPECGIVESNSLPIVFIYVGSGASVHAEEAETDTMSEADYGE